MVPGWYGKLPTLGDFASRRLDSDFLATWDGWLSRQLAAWQEDDPAHWRALYLGGPSWRFVLMPGALPGHAAACAWAGVLIPSVDQVGRCFPLTLLQALAQLPVGYAQTEALAAWVHRLDDLAVDALQERWGVERLEAELHRLGRWRLADGPPSDAALALQRRLQGQSLWQRSDAQGFPRLHISQGLPRHADFVHLLSGRCGATAEAAHAAHPDLSNLLTSLFTHHPPLP